MGALALLAVSAAHAASFEVFDGDNVRHLDSGWVFPAAVGGFVRVGDPGGIEGTTVESVASYQRGVEGAQDTATVTVYPPDSPALDASLQAAKSMIVASLKRAPLALSWSEGPFRVGKAPLLVGEKAYYKIGVGPTSSQTNLYYVDTGKWIVKVRMTADKTTEGTFQEFDAFVRGLPWESLALTAKTCTGVACQVGRPVPVHGLLPEQLAIMIVNAKVKDVFPRDTPPCEESALESALTAETPPQASGEPEPIVAVCAPRKGKRASFLRIGLPQDIREKLEKEGPDGLSLRDPLTFVVLSIGKDVYYTQMYDGRLDAATVAQVLKTLEGSQQMIFAKADKDGKHAQPIIRFVAGMAR